MDTLAKQDRSRLMGRIKGKNTSPEMCVRRLIHSMGYRFRLHVASLPGCPDLVFPSLKKAIFIHGCFWHRHSCHRGRSIPSTNVLFWQTKLDRNRARDIRSRRALRRLGWKVLVLWECQLRDVEFVQRRVVALLTDSEG
jgi:DNA mismatch endonuclease, patch repair protein